MYSISSLRSFSSSPMRLFTTSPMLMIPHRRPWLTTGTCRIRASVMRFMIESMLSSGEHWCTEVDISVYTGCSSRSPWSSLRLRTMSRSDTMPSMVPSPGETTRAPTRCRTNSATAEAIVAVREIVATRSPFVSRIVETCMVLSLRCGGRSSHLVGPMGPPWVHLRAYGSKREPIICDHLVAQRARRRGS